MVFHMADFSKFLKSLESLCNDSESLVKGFLTPCANFWVDFGWIHKCRKLAVLEQKAWAIAHGFEQCGFWQVLENAPNPLKRLLNPSKRISNSLRDFFGRFRVNSQVSKISRFWAKSLGYCPWFWTWRILESSGNLSKLYETTPIPL